MIDIAKGNYSDRFKVLDIDEKCWKKDWENLDRCGCEYIDEKCCVSEVINQWKIFKVSRNVKFMETKECEAFRDSDNWKLIEEKNNMIWSDLILR